MTQSLSRTGMVIPSADGSDGVNLPADLRTCPLFVETYVALYGTALSSSLPAAGTVGKWVKPTDQAGVIYWDNGSTLEQISPLPAVDPAQNVGGSRTLGGGHQQAAAGDHSHGIPTASQWTIGTTSGPSSVTRTGLIYAGGQFVALNSAGAGGGALTSPDGITWTARTMPSLGGGGWTGITYGGGQYVAVGGGFIAFAGGVATTTCATSPDGVTWTARTLPVSGMWNAVGYGGGLFVAVGASSTGASWTTFATSPDGITWTARTASVSGLWSDVAYGSGRFVVTCSGGSSSAQTSTDGITWGVSGGTGYGTRIVSDGTKFVCAYGAAAVYSPTGVGGTWAGIVDAVTLMTKSGIGYGNGTWLMSTGGSTTLGDGVAWQTSTDGATWVLRPAPAAVAGYTWPLAYGAGKWVALYGSTAYVSP